MSHQKSDLMDHELSGWNEIRDAMIQVEELRGQGIDAKLEITDKNCESCARTILHSFTELQQYISTKLSQLLVNGITTSIPLDDFERLVSEMSSSLLDESYNITGKLIS